MYRPSNFQSIFASQIRTVNSEPLRTEPVQMMPVITGLKEPAKKKKDKPKYLPGERLLRQVGKINTPAQEPEPELDMGIITNSINEMVSRMRL